MPPEIRDQDDCGRLLRAHRRQEGLSQERLAALAKLSPRTIRQIESGRSLPRPGTLKLLAETLNLSRDDWDRLLAAATPPEPGGDTAEAAPRPLPPAPPAPRLLPPAPGSFVGREDRLAALLGQAARHRLIVVDGMAGVGKTALVLHAAERLARRFPDGQLFVDLRGFSGQVAPLDAAEILNRLLRALGVDGRDIPVDGDERAALWRRTTADRRLLIVLDNAATAEQVRPVLPDGPDCLVLVSSRRRLPELDEASPVSVEVLPAEAAVRLFQRIAGLGADPGDREPIREIVEMCGRLPLAIRLAAARLKNRPGWTTRDLAGRLARQESPLSELDYSERGVSAAFESSYQDVPSAQRRLFRLLALFPGAGFGAVAAARLLDTGEVAAEELLERLVDSHLLLTPEPGRYEFHDLLRRFAARVVERDETPESMRLARTRLLDTYRARTLAAGLLIGPTFLSAVTERPAEGHGITDLDAANAWCQAELWNILAIVEQHADSDMESVMSLATGLSPYLNYHARIAELVRLARRCVGVARRTGDTDSEARWLNLEALANATGTDDALEPLFARALELRRRSGNVRGQVAVLNNLANYHMRRAEYHASAPLFAEAVRLAESVGAKQLEGLARTNFVGQELESEAVDADWAEAMLERARQIFSELGDGRELARVWYHRGTLLRFTGDLDGAIALHQRVAEYCAGQQETIGEVWAHLGLARDYSTVADFDAAERHCGRAARLIPEIGGGTRLWNRLRIETGIIAVGRGRYRTAVAELSGMVADGVEDFDRSTAREAHRRLARAYAGLGDDAATEHHARRARRLEWRPAGRTR